MFGRLVTVYTTCRQYWINKNLTYVDATVPPSANPWETSDVDRK